MKRLQMLEVRLGFVRQREKLLEWLIRTGEEKLDGKLVKRTRHEPRDSASVRTGEQDPRATG